MVLAGPLIINVIIELKSVNGTADKTVSVHFSKTEIRRRQFTKHKTVALQQ